MPQTKTKAPTKPRRKTAASAAVIQHPTLNDACDLITMMLNYESSARAAGSDLQMGRFGMLTASERQMLRAELVAEYIRLSAVNNAGNANDQFDDALEDFCSKISDMSIPSYELIGTYLAAVDVVTKGDQLSKVPGLVDAVRKTMITVLHGCVETMKRKDESTTE